MSSTDVAVPSSVTMQQRAEFISQTTAVEQARAVAEVQAAVIVAQQVPRSHSAAIEAMRESCKQTGLADRAFFKFPRGGQSVSGPSVHLARELARCWGNVQYGIQEMRRDDVGHYSEMQAWAWDVQTNTRSSQTFVVPHKRDKKGGAELLTDLRDVYENNANQGSRRLREAIFSILPPWFTEEAKELCTKTLTDGGGKSLATQIADAVAAFESVGVKVDRLERKVGSERGAWTAHDVAGLRVSFTSIRQGTITADEEFPAERVTVSDIVSPGEPRDVTPPASLPEAPPPARRLKAFEQLAVDAGKHGLETTDDVIRMVLDITGREVASLQDLTSAEIKQCRDVLAGYGPDAVYMFGGDSFVPPPVREGREEPAAPATEAPHTADPTAVPSSHPADAWSGDEWRAWLGQNQHSLGAFLTAARAVKPRPDMKINSIDDVVSYRMGGLVVAELEGGQS